MRTIEQSGVFLRIFILTYEYNSIIIEKRLINKNLHAK